MRIGAHGAIHREKVTLGFALEWMHYCRGWWEVGVLLGCVWIWFTVDAEEERRRAPGIRLAVVERSPSGHYRMREILPGGQEGEFVWCWAKSAVALGVRLRQKGTLRWHPDPPRRRKRS